MADSIDGPAGTALLRVPDIAVRVRWSEMSERLEWWDQGRNAWRLAVWVDAANAGDVMELYRRSVASGAIDISDEIDTQAALDKVRALTRAATVLDAGRMTIDDARKVARLVRELMPNHGGSAHPSGIMVHGAAARLAELWPQFDWEVRGGEIIPFVCVDPGGHETGSAEFEALRRRLHAHHSSDYIAAHLGVTPAEAWGRECPVCAGIAGAEERADASADSAFVTITVRGDSDGRVFYGATLEEAWNAAMNARENPQ